MEYQEKTATLDIAHWIGLSIRFPQQLLRIRLLSKARKPTGPTQQGQCYGEDHLLVFRLGTIYISKNIISLGRSVLNFFETTDWNILYECGSSVIFPGLDWSEWPSGKIFSFLKKGKSCTLRHCNSSSRPTTKLYLNKSIMNSIAMGREKKGHCTKPSQAHSFHANRGAPPWTGPSENSSGKILVSCPMISLILLHSRALPINCVSSFTAFSWHSPRTL